MAAVIIVSITGMTPLIMNRFHEEAQAEATSRVHSRKETLSPEDDAKGRLYQNEELGVYMPAEWVRQSVIEAAKRHKIGRRAATTDIAAAVYIEPFAMKLEGEWHVDTRPVVIPATQGRILRHRPMFETWSVKGFRLQVETDLVDEKLVRAVLDDSGRFVGVGDFRPTKKGPYGRFRVDSWERLSNHS